MRPEINTRILQIAGGELGLRSVSVPDQGETYQFKAATNQKVPTVQYFVRETESISGNSDQLFQTTKGISYA